MIYPFLLGAGTFDSSILNYESGRLSPLRKITFYEFDLFTESFEYGIYDGNIVPYEEGVIVIWKPGRVKCSRLDFRCRYLHTEVDDPEIRKLIEELPDYVRVKTLNKYLALFDKITYLHPVGSENASLKYTAYLLTLISYIKEDSSEPTEENNVVKSSGDSVGYLRAYIDKYYMNDLSLSKLSETVHLSESHLCRIFKDKVGISPYKYILNLRLSHACRILNYEDIGISEVSDLCGFSSYNSFNVAFVNRFGMSPKEYRKNSKNDLVQ